MLCFRSRGYIQVSAIVKAIFVVFQISKNIYISTIYFCFSGKYLICLYSEKVKRKTHILCLKATAHLLDLVSHERALYSWVTASVGEWTLIETRNTHQPRL